MPKAKKKLLPKNFEALLTDGDLVALKAVFDACDLNARGGYGKQTALAYDQCPDDLARWLVAQGADLSATDTYGRTPLHERAGNRQGRIDVLLELGADVHSTTSSTGTPLHSAASSHHARHALLLLQHGASVDAINQEGLTPLELALRDCRNIDLENMVLLGNALLEAGARKTSQMKEFVRSIGEEFEFHRSAFNRERVDDFSRALDQLYAMFETLPVPRRTMHDGKSPIVVTAQTWEEQHQELWGLLVPSSGPAATVQGEVIRISGRIVRELDHNGGGNWDADYKAMADAFLAHIQGGKPLPESELQEARALVTAIKRRSGDTTRLPQLALQWVLQNPQPTKLPPPAYTR